MSGLKHSLLKRQLKQFFGENVPFELKAFIDAVNNAYIDFDADRSMLERSLEYSSQELMQANSDMQAIFEAFPDIFLRIDFDGNVIEYKSADNRDSLFPSFGLVGKKIQDIASSSDRQGFVKSIDQVKNMHTIASLEFTIVYSEEKKFFEARFIPLKKPEIIVIIRDISDRKIVENELKQTFADLKKTNEDLTSTQSQLIQSEKLASIGQLAAGVAHEINNPIGYISNNMEVLQQYIDSYTQVFRMLERLKQTIGQDDIRQSKLIVEEISRFEREIDMNYVSGDLEKLMQNTQRGLERVRKIVLDLQTFSREGNDAMETVRIEEIIDSILSIVHSEFRHKVDLSKVYSSTPPVKCSLRRIGQVFINLIVNAAQAIEEEGTIEIKTYVQDQYVCVDVRDSGKGIPPENLKRIFDPFFTTKPVGRGAGLGLSVSYEIIKKHEGEIRVKSEVGKGTTFTILLPVPQEV